VHREETAKVYNRTPAKTAPVKTDGTIVVHRGWPVITRRAAQRSVRRKVLDDWFTTLPGDKNDLYEAVVRRWECTYAMMNVALDEALSLRTCGKLICARQQVSVAADLLERLSPALVSLCETLSARGQRVSQLPAVEPLNAEFFRSRTAQSAASWNGILHHVLFSVRSRFFHKLRILSHTIEQLDREFQDAASDVSKGLSVRPNDCWQRLDILHYDLNTCLRETEVVLKSFMRILPDEQLPALASELDAPPTRKGVRVKARLSGASASA
jgi:hypothetical protein